MRFDALFNRTVTLQPAFITFRWDPLIDLYPLRRIFLKTWTMCIFEMWQICHSWGRITWIPSSTTFRPKPSVQEKWVEKCLTLLLLTCPVEWPVAIRVLPHQADFLIKTTRSRKHRNPSWSRNPISEHSFSGMFSPSGYKAGTASEGDSIGRKVKDASTTWDNYISRTRICRWFGLWEYSSGLPRRWNAASISYNNLQPAYVGYDLLGRDIEIGGYEDVRLIQLEQRLRAV